MSVSGEHARIRKSVKDVWVKGCPRPGMCLEMRVFACTLILGNKDAGHARRIEMEKIEKFLLTWELMSSGKDGKHFFLGFVCLIYQKLNCMEWCYFADFS